MLVFMQFGALLIKNKIGTTNHTGTRLQFGQHFVKTGIIDKKLGKHYTKLFEKRQKGDYDDFSILMKRPLRNCSLYQKN